MLIALVSLIVFILLFGAGAVKGWLTNIVGFGLGGIILLVLALKLGSYFGEYGLLWVIGIVGGVVASGFAIGIHFEDKAKRQMLSGAEKLPQASKERDRQRRRLP